MYLDKCIEGIPRIYQLAPRGEAAGDGREDLTQVRERRTIGRTDR